MKESIYNGGVLDQYEHHDRLTLKYNGLEYIIEGDRLIKEFIFQCHDKFGDVEVDEVDADILREQLIYIRRAYAFTQQLNDDHTYTFICNVYLLTRWGYIPQDDNNGMVLEHTADYYTETGAYSYRFENLSPN